MALDWDIPNAVEFCELNAKEPLTMLKQYGVSCKQSVSVASDVVEDFVGTKHCFSPYAFDVAFTNFNCDEYIINYLKPILI